MAGGATCPHCARPVAAAQPRCVYCGGELPAEAVEAAAAARAALEAEWAREGTSSVAGLPATPDATATPRVLLVLETARADEAALARALSLSAFEASQRRRRGGPDLHRILPAAPAAEEAARLRAEGLDVLEIAEDDVRRAEPVMAKRGAAEPGALALDGDGGPLRVVEADILVIVRGVITREYQTTPEARRQRRLATLDPGYRVHLHRRQDPRPVELDPADFDFGPGGAPSGAQLRVAFEAQVMANRMIALGAAALFAFAASGPTLSAEPADSSPPERTLSQAALGEQNRYQCSYYLFEVPATVNGCSDCYVPLVVTRGPIEARRDQEVAVITTYERDSIWQVQRQVLKYPDLAIELAARRIKLGGKLYRYQLVGNTEPVRLLENPLGTIPVHRISHPRKDDDGIWEVLLRDLSMAGGVEPCLAGDAP
jgi:hypothetical protein